MAAAKRVLRYLQATKDVALFYPWKSSLKLTAYSDALYGNDIDSRRSFTGYIFQLGDSTISWRSRKQRSVATSTCEAEYMVLALTSKHHLWLQRGLKELLKQDTPNAIMSDSNYAIDIMNNPKINDSSKHFDIAYHFTREQVEAGNVTVLYVPSAENLADICTKGLSREILEHLCKKSFCTK
jgi:hypothetical protein